LQVYGGDVGCLWVMACGNLLKIGNCSAASGRQQRSRSHWLASPPQRVRRSAG
jgi:hypothetical protein